MHRFAAETTVPVGRTRGEIDTLLREWKCDQLQWSDDYQRGRVCLRFVWTHDKTTYVARFNLQLATEEQMRKEAIDQRDSSGKRIAETKLARLHASRGQQEHRVLLLWLKAALNAVEAGIVDAAAIFLPFLEDREGVTVAEMALPRLHTLLEGSSKLLLSGKPER
jgi:hypothetical protein